MRQPYIGGQAVLEGVMMRSPKSLVVAVRRPDGGIALREQAWTTLFPKLKFLRWPGLRGAVVLLESLHNGYSALMFSAEHAAPENKGIGRDGAQAESSVVVPVLLLGVATLLMIGLFIAAPHLLTVGLGRWLGLDLDVQAPAFHLLDGVLRIAILIGYILAVSRSEEMARVFQYHGAEHKAIWTYESNQPLAVENARRFTTLHPRCGTSFLFIVVMVAVALHLAVLPLLPTLHPHWLVNQLLLVAIKVPMAFPIAGLAYELQRLSARDRCPAAIRWLTQPGIWLQHVTTREPTDAQLEIALLALERTLAREEGRAASPDGVRLYPSFALARAA